MIRDGKLKLPFENGKKLLAKRDNNNLLIVTCSIITMVILSGKFSSNLQYLCISRLNTDGRNGIYSFGSQKCVTRSMYTLQLSFQLT